MNASEIIAQVSKLQPRLRCTFASDHIEFSGKFVLNSPQGEFDVFDVHIAIPTNFPGNPPRVWETGSRLPRDIDRHVYLDGECCITVWESWLLASDCISLEDYLRGPIFNFFLAQHQVENGKEWPFGEWKHGVRGIIDALAYSLKFQADGLALARFLVAIAKDDLRTIDACPCGSGRRIRKCHGKEIDRARKRLGSDRLVSIASEILNSRLASEKRAATIALIQSLITIEAPIVSQLSELESSASPLAIETVHRAIRETDGI